MSAPGSKWLLIGAAGFAAGFFGPLIFAPDANQGPLVGILISGPLGLVLGAALWGLCSLLKLPAQAQWRVLYSVATLGVLIVLFYVQRDPKVRGYVFDGAVESCATPAQTEGSVLEYWNKRIAEVDWAEPRAGWQQDMHRLLRDTPGAVVKVRIERKNAIKEHRKLWNRGRQFAAGWITGGDETPFYDADGDCDRYPAGGAIRGYQKSDYEERIRSVDIWPPEELLPVLRASRWAPIPEEWRAL